MAYTKLALLNDINQLIEKYVEQELAARLPPDTDEDDVTVVIDADGHYIDLKTGNIWNLESQTIIGQKDLVSGAKTWTEILPKDHSSVSEESLNKLIGQLPIAEPISDPKETKEPITEPIEETKTKEPKEPKEPVTSMEPKEPLKQKRPRKKKTDSSATPTNFFKPKGEENLL